MVKLIFIPYKLTIIDKLVRKKGREKRVNLKEINFSKLFKEFLQDKKYIIEDEEQKYLECDDLKYNKDDDIYYGKIGCGDYGYKTEIVNVNTRKKTKDKEINEAEKTPFYYMMKIFDNYAIILINQFKKRGIKGELHYNLGKYLIEKKVGAGLISLKINPVVSFNTASIKNICELRYIRERTPKDIERGVLKDMKLEEDLNPFIEEKVIQIKDKRFPIKKFIKKIEILSKNEETKKYLEIDGNIYDTLRMKVEMDDGRTKMIVIEKGLIFNEGNEVEFEGDFPSLEQFYNKLLNYLNEVTEDV